MYIPEFWCGVISVVLAEVTALTIYVIYDHFKNKKGGK